MKILHVVGARPNFMKVAPVLRAFRDFPGIDQILVHTGQHYDRAMSEVFFDQLDLPAPDINLDVGSGSHAIQTGLIMQRFETVALESKPDLVLVYGDVNSTVGSAIVCAKLCIPVGHVEAGLRSFDRSMPEEINRLLTDRISDILFTPSRDADENLGREGVDPTAIRLVGNVMIDTLIRLLPKAQAQWKDNAILGGWNGKSYALVTLHRPSNVDDPKVLNEIVNALQRISLRLPVIFPIHPRTRTRLKDLGYANTSANLAFLDPLPYLDFLALQTRARVVITDSGGIQEETTYMGIPCLTVRENTERPITVSMGTNTLVGQDMTVLVREVSRIVDGNAKKGTIPPLWDGRAGTRIAEYIAGRI
jgi:UDP-N-acetylglucosamine 2-epimerase (non-hydrolysing)